MLAASGGIGGGGILVPLYLVVLGFDTSRAVALSNITILGSTLTNLAINVGRRHPLRAGTLIDWDLILLMEPCTIMGAVFGGYANRALPGWLTTALLTSLLGFMTVKLVGKARDARSKELRNREELDALMARIDSAGGDVLGATRTPDVLPSPPRALSDDALSMQAARGGGPGMGGADQGPAAANVGVALRLHVAPQAQDLQQHAHAGSGLAGAEVDALHRPASDAVSVPGIPTGSVMGDDGRGARGGQDAAVADGGVTLHPTPFPPVPGTPVTPQLLASRLTSTAGGRRPLQRSPFSSAVSIDGLPADLVQPLLAQAEAGAGKGVAWGGEAATQRGAEPPAHAGLYAKPSLGWAPARERVRWKVEVPTWKAALLAALVVLVVALDLLKSRFQCPSPPYWAASLALVPVSLLVLLGVRSYLLRAAAVRRVEGDIVWTARTTLLYPVLCSFAGVCAGTFGIGGGIVKGPLMLEMGVLPEVAAATSATMIFFTSASASVVFISMGLLPRAFAIALFLSGVLFTALGQAGTMALQRRVRSRAVVVWVMAAVVGLSTLVLAAQTVAVTETAIHHHAMWDWGTLCGNTH